MDDQTRIITKEEAKKRNIAPASESHMFNVSVRAWITLIVICTICYMALQLIEVKEPLYSISLITIGFFFGQGKQSRPTTPTPPHAPPPV